MPAMEQALPAPVLYERLLRAAAALPADAPLELRWNHLMAAHVVGQAQLALHWDSHWRMLALAWRTRDWPELAGQLLRLALTPPGHALGKLPLGNVGRATVPALRPMRPPPEVRRLIALHAAPA